MDNGGYGSSDNRQRFRQMDRTLPSFYFEGYWHCDYLSPSHPWFCLLLCHWRSSYLSHLVLSLSLSFNLGFCCFEIIRTNKWWIFIFIVIWILIFHCDRKIHKSQPNAIELLELCPSKEFPRTGLRITFSDALSPFAFLCENEVVQSLTLSLLCVSVFFFFF